MNENEIERYRFWTTVIWTGLLLTALVIIVHSETIPWRDLVGLNVGLYDIIP